MTVFAGAAGQRRFLRAGIPVHVVLGNGRRTVAQLDTGSSISSVDRSLVSDLPVVGWVQVAEVDRVVRLPLYPVSLRTPGGYLLTPGPVLGATLPEPQQALLGREVQAKLRFVLDGATGSWAAEAAGTTAAVPRPGWGLPAGLAGALGIIALVAGYGRA